MSIRNKKGVKKQKMRGEIPRVFFEKIKDAILGKKYLLETSVISSAKIKRFNLIYRNIDSATDILSFPIEKDLGEIYLCLREVRKEAKKFKMTDDDFLTFLFIHGCVHLKGHDHGDKMEKIEKKFRKKFGLLNC